MNWKFISPTSRSYEFPLLQYTTCLLHTSGYFVVASQPIAVTHAYLVIAKIPKFIPGKARLS